MANYLTIILRNQFNLLYRCGYTMIPKSKFIPFNGEINKNTIDILFNAFKNETPFDYEEEYLILELNKKNIDFLNVELIVTDILKIYPLSERAKQTIESRLDQRIRLEPPLFEDVLSLIEIRDQKHQIKWGINALGHLCEIDAETIQNIKQSIGEQNILDGLENRNSGIKSDEIFKENYWQHLLSYDRYEYYPNTTLGYFFDAGQIYAQSVGKKTFEGSGVHSYLVNLEQTNPNLNILEILELFENDEEPRAFVSKNTAKGVKQYLVTVLFLKLKDEIRKKDSIKETVLLKRLDFFHSDILKDSFDFSVVLLGAFFGLKEFYDEYYNCLDLKFYKDPKEIAKNIIEETKIIDPEEIANKIDGSATLGDKSTSLASKAKSNEENCIDIISDIFLNETTMELRDIVKIIKQRSTMKKVDQKYLKSIIDKMNGIEIKTEKKIKIAYSKTISPELFE